MNFDSVEKIAAAILYEGYILYPYRPTAIKNRQRWNFGTLYPRIYAEMQSPPESFNFIAECLATPGPKVSLHVKINFLQMVRQSQHSANPHSGNVGRPLDPSLEWDEAIERSSEHHNLWLNDLIASPLVLNLHMNEPSLSKGQSCESVPSLQAILRIDAEMLQDGACKIHLELQNTSRLSASAVTKREQVLPHSFVSAHALLGITGGEFVSLLEPGDAYRESAVACSNAGVFPVLVGEEPDRSMMLCSPIILYDYPRIAPESAGDFFDGTEMDEMLSLRVLTLTDAEKQEMRNSDSHARKILERTESLSAESLLKAHGVIRGRRYIREDTP